MHQNTVTARLPSFETEKTATTRPRLPRAFAPLKLKWSQSYYSGEWQLCACFEFETCFKTENRKLFGKRFWVTSWENIWSLLKGTKNTFVFLFSKRGFYLIFKPLTKMRKGVKNIQLFRQTVTILLSSLSSLELVKFEQSAAQLKNKYNFALRENAFYG